MERTCEFGGEVVWDNDSGYLIDDGVERFWLNKDDVINSRKVSGSDFIFVISERLARKMGIIGNDP